MTKEERKAIYDRAIKAWGQDAQENMAIEEMSELIKELCKLKRVRGTGQPLMNPIAQSTINNIIEEIADVEITVEQLKHFFGADKVEEVKLKKLQRLEGRLTRVNY